MIERSSSTDLKSIGFSFYTAGVVTMCMTWIRGEVYWPRTRWAPGGRRRTGRASGWSARAVRGCAPRCRARPPAPRPPCAPSRCPASGTCLRRSQSQHWCHTERDAHKPIALLLFYSIHSQSPNAFIGTRQRKFHWNDSSLISLAWNWFFRKNKDFTETSYFFYRTLVGYLKTNWLNLFSQSCFKIWIHCRYSPFSKSILKRSRIHIV